MPFRESSIHKKEEKETAESQSNAYLPLTRNKHSHKILRDRDYSPDLMPRIQPDEQFSKLVDDAIPGLMIKPSEPFTSAGYLSIPDNIDNPRKNASMKKIPSYNLIRMHDLSPRLASIDEPRDKLKYFRKNLRHQP
jgi:hypothetical protein